MKGIPTSLFLAPGFTAARLRNSIAESGVKETLAYHHEHVSLRSKKGWRKVYLTLTVVASPTL